MKLAEEVGTFDARTSTFVLTSDALLPKLMSGEVELLKTTGRKEHP